MMTNEAVRQNIAFHVTKLLEDRGLTRSWLARATGEWDSRIGAVCAGTNICSAALLSRIADALDVPMDDLVKPIPAPERRRIAQLAR